MQTKPHYVPSHHSPLPRSTPRPGSSVESIARGVLQPPVGFVAALGEGICWIAAAILLRVVAQGMLMSSPAVWSVTLVLVLAPAFVAVGLSAIAPRLSLLVGYRLVLLMVGLLIGGKL